MGYSQCIRLESMQPKSFYPGPKRDQTSVADESCFCRHQGPFRIVWMSLICLYFYHKHQFVKGEVSGQCSHDSLLRIHSTGFQNHGLWDMNQLGKMRDEITCLPHSGSFPFFCNKRVVSRMPSEVTCLSTTSADRTWVEKGLGYF